MSKLIVSVVAGMLLLPALNPGRERFAKYKAVEAYEIRPGILMMPRYSADGQVCEIGLEKLHYSPEMIRLDSSLSREEIGQIFDELAPSAERGPKPTDLLEQGTSIQGSSMVSHEEYQNVSIQIYSALTVNAKGRITEVGDQLAATLKWKNRTCQ
jgi:hypothetical protein